MTGAGGGVVARAVYHSVSNGQIEAGANLRAYLLGGFEFAAFT